MYKDQNGSASGVTIALIALVISVLALVLAWMAYNRAGTDLEDQIQREVNSQMESAGRATDDAAREITNEVEQEAQDAEQRIDEGPDGVDEDDTDVPQQ